jgi:hypothetical protein
MVRLSDGSELCRVCNQKPSVVLCDGCEKALCADCRKFDLWGYGCGHVDTKVFCEACARDPRINPYGGCID